MRFFPVVILGLLGFALPTSDVHAWPRTRPADYSSSYLAPYYPPGPIYPVYSIPYPTIAYYPGFYPPALPSSGYYPSQYGVFDVPLSTTGAPRYWHGLSPPSSDDYSSERWRR